MGTVYRIDHPVTLALANVVRRQESSSDQINRALSQLGGEVAREIAERFFVRSQRLTTPLNHQVTGPILDFPLTVAITPREDLRHFAYGLQRGLGNCDLGWMDFEGRRGLQALNTPVRQSSYPDLSGQAVDTLVIGKATLATGCTAVALTKNAYRDFMPNRLVIASVFYTIRGLEWLQRDFPNAHLFVVGDPDELDEDGMLVPGIGNLPERTGGLDA